MPKEEWGVKRLCAECGARFYDLGRDPVDCPSCGAAYVPAQAAVVKSRVTKVTPRRAVDPGDEDDDDLEVIEKDEGDEDEDDAEDDQKEVDLEANIVIPTGGDDDDDDGDIVAVGDDDDEDDDIDEDVLLEDDDDEDDDDDLDDFALPDPKDKDLDPHFPLLPAPETPGGEKRK